MNKANVFCSSPFYMSVGDILHILIIDETGGPIEIELSGDEDNYAPSAPIALDATDIAETSFTANWYFNENTTGYYLDVATDSAFSSMVTGYDNKDVLNVDSASVTGLSASTAYYYRLRAYNDYGTSPNSNIITVTSVVDLTYGPLYNWYAATYNTGGASIAPTGWHVPSSTEWDTLITTLGGDVVAGGHLKEVGVTHWNNPNVADNTSLFTAVGTGSREIGVFADLKTECDFWTTDEHFSDPLLAYFYYLQNGDTSITFDALPKETGMVIRCIKNVGPDTGTVIDFDGNVYATITIGAQILMAENLRVTHYNDGTDIPNITNNTLWTADTAGAMCWYNNVAP